MKIPFTVDQFLNVFGEYNSSVWPMQIILYLLAIIAIVMIFSARGYSNKVVAIILSLFWLWMGIVYHIIYFSSINQAAYVFGSLFVIQGILFLYQGVIKGKFSFSINTGPYGITGGIFIIFALAIYPVLGYYSGHIYPESPTFGAPCPTVIFTFGILLLSSKKVSGYLLVIPFLWSVIGFSAAVNLMVKEDLGLVLAGLLGVILIIIKNHNISKHKLNVIKSGN